MCSFHIMWCSSPYSMRAPMGAPAHVSSWSATESRDRADILALNISWTHFIPKRLVSWVSRDPCISIFCCSCTILSAILASLRWWRSHVNNASLWHLPCDALQDINIALNVTFSKMCTIHNINKQYAAFILHSFKSKKKLHNNTAQCIFVDLLLTSSASRKPESALDEIGFAL